MILLIMIGVAAILFVLSVISLQIASFKPQGTLTALGLMLVFVVNLIIAAVLIMGAIGSSLITY